MRISMVDFCNKKVYKIILSLDHTALQVIWIKPWGEETENFGFIFVPRKGNNLSFHLDTYLFHTYQSLNVIEPGIP